MDNGFFTLRKIEGRPNVFHGEVKHNRIFAESYLIPITDKKGGKITRDFDLKLWSVDIRDWVTVGGAKWADMRTGGRYLKIWLDETDLDFRHWFGAFPADEQPKDATAKEPVLYDLRFSNTSRRSAGFSRRNASGGGADDPARPLNDAIPY